MRFIGCAFLVAWLSLSLLLPSTATARPAIIQPSSPGLWLQLAPWQRVTAPLTRDTDAYRLWSGWAVIREWPQVVEWVRAAVEWLKQIGVWGDGKSDGAGAGRATPQRPVQEAGPLSPLTPPPYQPPGRQLAIAEPWVEDEVEVTLLVFPKKSANKLTLQIGYKNVRSGCDLVTFAGCAGKEMAIRFTVADFQILDWQGQPVFFQEGVLNEYDPISGCTVNILMLPGTGAPCVLDLPLDRLAPDVKEVYVLAPMVGGPVYWFVPIPDLSKLETDEETWAEESDYQGQLCEEAKEDYDSCMAYYKETAKGVEQGGSLTIPSLILETCQQLLDPCLSR